MKKISGHKKQKDFFKYTRLSEKRVKSKKHKKTHLPLRRGLLFKMKKGTIKRTENKGKVGNNLHDLRGATTYSLPSKDWNKNDCLFFLSLKMVILIIIDNYKYFRDVVTFQKGVRPKDT